MIRRATEAFLVTAATALGLGTIYVGGILGLIYLSDLADYLEDRKKEGRKVLSKVAYEDGYEAGYAEGHHEGLRTAAWNGESWWRQVRRVLGR